MTASKRSESAENPTINPTDRYIKENNGNTAQRLPKACPKIALTTFESIKQNPTATVKQLSETTKQSERTIKDHISKLKEAGLIKRTGGKTYGQWEVLNRETL